MSTDKTTDKKQAIAAVLIAAAVTIAAVLTGTKIPDACQPCDCTGAVVALPGDVTALAADASAVTAVAQ